MREAPPLNGRLRTFRRPETVMAVLMSASDSKRTFALGTSGAKGIHLSEPDLEKRLMAAAIFELRVLLASHIGQEGTPAGAAADFAYALHNPACAILEGRPVDVPATLDTLEQLEPALGEKYLRQFRRIVLQDGGSS